MAKSTKYKWMIGLTGTAFSAFVIGQIGTNPGDSTSVQQTDAALLQAMEPAEQELFQLDWSNYQINGIQVSGGEIQSDAQTRRS